MKRIKKMILLLTCSLLATTNLVLATPIKNTGEKKTDTDYNISTLHGNMPYWDWNKADETYLGELIYSVANYETRLYEEISILNKKKEVTEANVEEINGIKFYDSVTMGVLDSLSRGIIARTNILQGNTSYPIRGKSGYIPDSILTTDMTIYNDVNDIEELSKSIQSDKKVVAAIENIPDIIPINDNLKVFNLPYQFKSLYEACASLGGFSDSNRGLIGLSAMDESDQLFYHELGHIWANDYLINYVEYSQMRDGNHLDQGLWANRIEENFSEDFKFAYYPFDTQLYFLGSLGTPTAKETAYVEKMVEVNTTKVNDNTSFLVNGVDILGNIIVSDGQFTFSGEMSEPFSIDIVDIEGVEKNLSVVPTLNKYETSVNLPHGIYEMTSYFGDYTIISTATSEFAGAGNSVEEVEETWEIIDQDTMSNTLKAWKNHKQYYAGVWCKDQPDGLYVLITNGMDWDSEANRIPQGIELSSVNIGGENITVNVSNGSENSILLKFPNSAKDKLIDVNGLTNEYAQEDCTANVILKSPFPNQTVTDFMFLRAELRSPSGKAHFVVENNGKEVYTKTFILNASYPHFDLISEDMMIDEMENGTVQFKFYEDSSKENELYSSQTFTSTEMN